MNKQEDEFVRSGFEFFPQAIDAIDSFTRLLGDELRQAVSRVDPPHGLRLETSNYEATWGALPGSGCWVFAVVPVAKSNAQLSIDVGWWWNAPGAPVPVILYCTLRQGNRRLRLDDHKSDQVEAAKIDGAWRLFIKSFESREKALQSLLSEALRAILLDSTVQ